MSRRSSGSLFSGVNVTGSSYGYYITGSASPTITNGLVYGNSSTGMYVDPTSGTPTITVNGPPVWRWQSAQWQAP